MDVQTKFPLTGCATAQTRMDTGLRAARALQQHTPRMKARRMMSGDFDTEWARRIGLNDGQIGMRNFFRAAPDFAPNAPASMWLS